MPFKVFFCEPVYSKVSISVYSKDAGCAKSKNTAPYNWHRAEVMLPDIYPRGAEPSLPSLDDKSLPWPTVCACGFAFTAENSNRSAGGQTSYRRIDTGEIIGRLANAPVGACWDLEWYRAREFFQDDGKPYWLGPDGRILCVKTPGGDWVIDSRASNCTMKDDTAHRCWVRHGSPEDGTLHVDKNGNTCAAGAGSIMCGSYHGFLHNGNLTDHC